jgi:hypothetical protein
MRSRKWTLSFAIMRLHGHCCRQILQSTGIVGDCLLETEAEIEFIRYDCLSEHALDFHLIALSRTLLYQYGSIDIASEVAMSMQPAQLCRIQTAIQFGLFSTSMTRAFISTIAHLESESLQ